MTLGSVRSVSDVLEPVNPVRVLVVCAGNTCRSPAAKVAIEASAARAGIAIEVTSAGTVAAEGSAPSTMMRRVASERGLEITGAAQHLAPRHLADVDIVLALDRSVELFVRTMTQNQHVALLGSYVASADDEIADPWGSSEREYARTLDAIIEAAEAFVSTLSG